MTLFQEGASGIHFNDRKLMHLILSSSLEKIYIGGGAMPEQNLCRGAGVKRL